MNLTKLYIPPGGNNRVYRSELYEKLKPELSRMLILNRALFNNVVFPAGILGEISLILWIIVFAVDSRRRLGQASEVAFNT